MEPPEPCPFRYIYKGRTFCAIAIRDRRYTTTEVMPGACDECRARTLLRQIGCAHLSLGVEVDIYGGTLTVTEFLILQSLAARPGHVKSRDQLMDAAYGENIYVDDRTIDSHIKRLRKKFKVVDDDFDMIETLYGVGYRFKEA